MWSIRILGDASSKQTLVNFNIGSGEASLDNDSQEEFGPPISK